MAPERRAPNRMEAWFSSSEMIKQPLPTRAGKAEALVWKPMEKTMEASLPTKRATRSSISTCRSVVPV